MLNSKLKEYSSDVTFMKQVDSIRSLINSNVKDAFQNHPHSSMYLRPVSLANITYCYILALAYEYDNPHKVTLEEVLRRSDEYNQAISAYFRKSFEERIFELIKNSVINNNIPREVFEYIIEEECSSYEYITPESIVNLALKILDIKEGETVVDIGSGSGNFILNGAAENPQASFTGFEINTELYLISLIRSYFYNGKDRKRNIKIIQADAFDIVIGSKPETSFDKVFANYPVGMKLKFSGIGQRYLKQVSNRFSKLIPSSSGDWVYNMLIRDITTNSPYGKAIGIMASGSSWNITDRAVRKYFLERGIVECVIALPAKLFDYTSIPMMMVVFGFGHKQVRMIDATNLYHPGRRQNYMDSNHIAKIVEALNTDCEYSKLVSFQEIQSQEYVLNPGRYLQQKIEIKDGVPFDSVIKNITRGAQIRAKELDKMVSHTPTNMQYLTLSNIRDGLIDEELSSLSAIDASLERYCLKDNDLILSKNGYPYKVAIAHLKPGQKILANGSLYIIELDQDKINPFFLKAFLESEVGINTLKSITVGATIPNISVGSLKKIMIPLPPMEKQNAIADKYMEQLEEIAALRVKLDKAIKRLGEIF